jgi:putative endopeptidase
MNYTHKIRDIKNKTKKKKCSTIVYKPFEKKYQKTLTGKNLRTTNKKIIKDFLQQIKAEYSSTHAKPQNDFYTYINYTWLEDKSFDTIKLKYEQKYITKIDNFRLVQNNVFKELEELVKEYIKNNKNEETKQLTNYFHSAYNRTPIKISKKYITDTIQKIDELRKDNNNIWKMLAWVNSLPMMKAQAPFVWEISMDEKNSGKFISHLYPHIFPLVDITVYENGNNYNKYKESYKNAFYDYCDELFEATLGKNNKLNCKDPFNVSKDLYDAFICDNKIIEDINGYNIITSEEALNKYNFNWNEFCKELGYKNIPNKFVCSNLNYLKCATKIMTENWNSEKWRPYWIWLFTRQYARLTKKWIKIFYNFYGKYSRAEEIINPHYVGSIVYTSLAYNKLLSKLYIDKYLDHSKLQFVSGLSEDLKYVFIRILQRNNWLSISTKKLAIQKLEKLQFIFVEPKKMIDDPILTYDYYDLIGNINKVSEWTTKKYIELDGKDFIDLPTIDWTSFPAKFTGTQPYIVNAFYIPNRNSMYIPLAYIQRPFVELQQRGIEYNLAQFGFTIAHELSHSLDTTGSKYDQKGNLNDWWSNIDKIKYEKIQNNIMKQYKEWTERDGLNYDPSIGIEEDIADISGLAICEEYLRDFQVKNKIIMPVRTKRFNIFYINYAYQNRQKIGKKALLVELKTDPHPLVKYRTNIPLSRSDIFVANYDVKKGDGMYWSDRSTIW